VFVVKPSVVLELTFVKRCLLFFVYGSCRKERTNVTRRSKKRRKNRRKEPRAHSAEKVPISPVLSPVFHSHSAEFLQQAVSLILLSFPYLFYCPWSVLLENPANRIWYQSLVQRSILGRNLKRKKRIS
jgi:hypothetical protein